MLNIPVLALHLTVFEREINLKRRQSSTDIKKQPVINDKKKKIIHPFGPVLAWLKTDETVEGQEYQVEFIRSFFS